MKTTYIALDGDFFHDMPLLEKTVNEILERLEKLESPYQKKDHPPFVELNDSEV